MCVCVCVFVFLYLYMRMLAHVYAFTHVYAYTVCVRACVHVCPRPSDMLATTDVQDRDRALQHGDSALPLAWRWRLWKARRNVDMTTVV